ncbi:class I SAM-dependent methyltransferase [Thermoproteota archaeon]
MDGRERRAWMDIIDPTELNMHIAETGQAETNAKLMELMLKEYPVKDLLIPGCGNAQFADYVDPDFGCKLTLTDIRPEFLVNAFASLRGKVEGYSTGIDDIEDTKLKGPYGGIFITLVLQHVEWRKAIDSMLSLNPTNLYTIIQEQKDGRHPVTLTRKLLPSIREFSEMTSGLLVPRDGLVEHMNGCDYNLLKTYERPVPDDKVMTGLVFGK